VLGDAVAAAVQKLFIIGGFMIFAAMTAKLTSSLFSPNGFSIVGQAILESHLGAYAAAALALAGKSLMIPAAIIAAVLAWSGISGILQTSYVSFGTGIKIFPLVLYRVLHAAHAFLFTIILWKPLSWLLSHIVIEGTFPVFRFVTNQWNNKSIDSRDNLLFLFHDLPYIWQLALPIAAGASLLLFTIYLLLKIKIRN